MRHAFRIAGLLTAQTRRCRLNAVQAVSVVLLRQVDTVNRAADMPQMLKHQIVDLSYSNLQESRVYEKSPAAADRAS